MFSISFFHPKGNQYPLKQINSGMDREGSASRLCVEGRSDIEWGSWRVIGTHSTFRVWQGHFAATAPKFLGANTQLPWASQGLTLGGRQAYVYGPTFWKRDWSFTWLQTWGKKQLKPEKQTKKSWQSIKLKIKKRRKTGLCIFAQFSKITDS